MHSGTYKHLTRILSSSGCKRIHKLATYERVQEDKQKICGIRVVFIILLCKIEMKGIVRAEMDETRVMNECDIQLIHFYKIR